MRIIAILCLLFLVGCGRNDVSGGPVLAKVDDYTITAQDLQDELSGNTMARMLSSGVSPSQVKEAVLQDMINRQILLEEAQKEGLDRDRKFLKEIEGYWRQTLIKLMLAKKSQEIRLAVKATDDDIAREYARHRRKLQAQIIVSNSKEAARQLSGSASEPEWWQAGELPYKLEDIIFNLKLNEVSKPFMTNGKWAVARVIGEEKVEIAPLGKVKAEIIAAVLKKKSERELERWLADMESGVKITRYSNSGGSNGK